MSQKLRNASPEDFQVGTTLVNKYDPYEFTITRYHGNNIWDAVGVSGERTISENEADHWYVKE